jgi:thioredoxin 2
VHGRTAASEPASGRREEVFLMTDEQTRTIRCPACGARNRIPVDKDSRGATCGKCHSPLDGGQEPPKDAGTITLRCTECWTRNKIPLDKVDEKAKCGKCGAELKTEGLLSTASIIVGDSNFEEKVMRSPLPVLLFAWAPWCPTCRSFLPVVDAFGRDSKGKVRVAKINVDSNPRISSTYDILSVPQIFIFDKGQLRENLPGALQENEIMMKMARYLL